MKKNFGRFSRTESGEIQISLEEVQGELYLDLRIYSGPASDGEGSRPERLVMPVRMLSQLCEILQQIKDDLLKFEEALADAASPSEGKTVEARKPVVVLRGGQPSTHPDRPVPVRLPVQCRLLRGPKSWPTKPATEEVTGETRDLSSGGAQVWLPEQFPVGCHLALFMRTGELTFRAQAEVKGVASDPDHGHYRHNLKWMVLDPQARAALVQIIETAAHAATPRA